MRPILHIQRRCCWGHLSAFLACIILSAAADGPTSLPVLTIGFVTETNPGIELSPLGWASKPVLVDLKSKTVHVRSGECQFAASVVCPEERVLAVQIFTPSGHTNELEWTADLVTWIPSNVRWISDGTPVRYYAVQPTEHRFYRVKLSNTPPKAVITISPVVVLPGTTNLVTASLNSTDAAVVASAIQTSDADNDQLSFAWLEGTNVFASTIVVTNRHKLGHHTIMLKVHDGIATATASASFETVSISVAIEALIATVRGGNGTPTLPGNMQSTTAMLESALASFNRGNINAGLRQLRSARHQIETHRLGDPPINNELARALETLIAAVVFQQSVQ